MIEVPSRLLAGFESHSCDLSAQQGFAGFESQSEVHGFRAAVGRGCAASPLAAHVKLLVGSSASTRGSLVGNKAKPGDTRARGKETRW